jgi:cystathionine beta-lyase/cystathionine gamma-synthase
LVTKSVRLSEDLRYWQKTTGANLAPFDSFLVARGIKTLALRMDKAQANAFQVAEWLKAQKAVTKVFFVGDPGHPGYAVSSRQASGYGSMISFELESEELAIQILERVQLVLFAESLGGVETLITYPYMQTHADVPEEIRERKGINRRLLRLSVGIENATDLIEDLAQALGGN